MNHTAAMSVGRRYERDRVHAGRRAAAALALTALMAWTGPARGEQVQVFGRIVDISTFNTAAARPRLDANASVELTFAVERVISQDVAERVGKVLTMYLPLEEAALRSDVVDLHVGDSTYLTLTLGSPVRHFRFHPEAATPPLASQLARELAAKERSNARGQ